MVFDAITRLAGRGNRANARHPNFCGEFPSVTHDILIQELEGRQTPWDILNALKLGELIPLWSEI